MTATSLSVTTLAMMKIALTIACIAVVCATQLSAVSAYSCSPNEFKETLGTIKEGFVSLFCCAKNDNKPNVLEGSVFLSDYFDNYSQGGFLQQQGFRKYLRQSLSKGFGCLRTSLKDLKSKCVKAVKHDVSEETEKVDKDKFIRYFALDLQGSHHDVCSQVAIEKCQEPVNCSPSEFEEAAGAIKEGFLALYCAKKFNMEPQSYSPTTFLSSYFEKFRTEDGILPQKGFRKYLRQSLKPVKNFDEQRKRLLNLRSQCVKAVKHDVSEETEKVDEEKFIRYFYPGLTCPHACEQFNFD